MHADLCWVPGDASVRDAARIMRDRSLGFLLISGAAPGQLAGVVTDRDLAVRVCTEDKRSQDVRIGDIASKDVIVCGEDQELAEAELQMRNEQKSRLVVVNGSGQPVGILSLTNIVFGDRAGRAIKTARGVLVREAEGAHTPIEQIKLTPSTPEDEEAASHQESVMTGRTVSTSTKMFP
jgi:signal-transduction protein with cAMP-binding, CBS, and nucleotidyltransferase domain